MVKDAVHRGSLLVAVGALILVCVQSVLTNALVAALALALTVGLWVSRASSGFGGYPALATFAVAAAGLAPMHPGPIRALYSVAVHLCFASMMGLVLTTSKSWSEGPALVDDGGTPSLRSLSVVGAGATLLQVLLGAAFRNDLIGFVPHVVGAILVTMVLLIVACFVLTQFPQHGPLKKAAWVVIGLVPVQVALGIAAYMARLAQAENTSSLGALSASTVAHLLVGALTLAGIVSLALQVFYHVRPQAALKTALSAER